ncbi:MAG: radical SAM protein [Ardenticatenaceae bacterium]|nr:radical SAM protein [Ardenticatenaceae bacterium]
MSGFEPLIDQWPIYRQEPSEQDYALFYAPGYIAVVPSARVDDFTQDILSPVPCQPVAMALHDHAHLAQTARLAQTEGSFRPICLTLYLHNECNLHCTYCFANPSHTPQARLQIPEIRAAAQLVLENCRERKRPFTLVIHGGGEPTLHQPLLEETINTIEEMAASYNLPLFRYIATNGIMSATKAKWVAQHFDLVGLSCDGPPEIQDRQRPAYNGQHSSQQVAKTAVIIRESGTPLHVRVTLLPSMLNQQVRIAHYLCQTLQPTEIHVEPVYHVGRATQTIPYTPEQSDQFVIEFYRAQQVARQYGVHWSTSGSRPYEIHGPYCHVFRDVLNLVPGGIATACFQTTDKAQAEQVQANIGSVQNNRFVLAPKHIATLRQKYGTLPTACQNCFNQFHCTRTCPNTCLPQDTTTTPFYCLVQQKLMHTQLQTIAHQLRNESPHNNEIIGRVIERSP